MGHKIRPDSFRLGIMKPWKSRWFFKEGFKDFLEQDEIIRHVINKKISAGGIVSIEIERTGNECKIHIRAARPGLIIGRGGQGIEDLNKAIVKALKKTTKDTKKNFPINLNIEELKRTEISAVLMAQQIAWDLEKRFKFRRTLKKYIELAEQNRDVKGVKIKVSGRLDGAEIARTEWLAKGTIPLQTLRADIDYGDATAFTTFGTIGVKVWINKGEIFAEKPVAENKSQK
ncbi:MAG: 30S ribosomal protein S3 [Candidatus Paceibacterota bacterium]